ALWALTHGETVTYDSPHFKLEGARVRVDAAPPPLYLAALGPEMVKLGGELADGLPLNASPPEYLPKVRALVAEGAAKAGRQAGDVKLMQGVRLVIDDDVVAARRTLVKGLMGGAPIQEPGPRRGAGGLSCALHQPGPGTGSRRSGRPACAGSERAGADRPVPRTPGA